MRRERRRGRKRPNSDEVEPILGKIIELLLPKNCLYSGPSTARLTIAKRDISEEEIKVQVKF